VRTDSGAAAGAGGPPTTPTLLTASGGGRQLPVAPVGEAAAGAAPPSDVTVVDGPISVDAYVLCVHPVVEAHCGWHARPHWSIDRSCPPARIRAGIRVCMTRLGFSRPYSASSQAVWFHRVGTPRCRLRVGGRDVVRVCVCVCVCVILLC
jgi:hypothetical protein